MIFFISPGDLNLDAWYTEIFESEYAGHTLAERDTLLNALMKKLHSQSRN